MLPLLLAVLLAAQSASAKTLYPIFHAVSCPNGYSNAYIVTIVDTDTGCVEAAWGVDCHGKEYTLDYSMLPVSEEPRRPYTFMDQRPASNGASFYVKVALNDAGEVTDVWGRDAFGRYSVTMPRE